MDGWRQHLENNMQMSGKKIPPHTYVITPKNVTICGLKKMQITCQTRQDTLNLEIWKSGKLPLVGFLLSLPAADLFCTNLK